MEDPQLRKTANPNTRGYCPSEDNPVASSALRVIDRSGAVVSEAAVYPDVDVHIESLGSGTDVFRITEFMGCPGGNSSGWNTVFLEVRNGHVARLRAYGENGEEREVAMSATNDERWKLTQRNGRTELVVQLEGSPPEPALIETRFWFENGAYRFLEQIAVAYDPAIAKQSGPWHGALDFHGAGWGAPEASL